MAVTYADKNDSYQSGVSNLANGGINSKKADGTVEKISSQSKKEEKTYTEVAEQARQTNGKGQSIRENIADHLPDSRLKDSMLRKAEANRGKRRVIDERKKAGEMTPRELKRSAKEIEKRDKRMDEKYPGEREQAKKEAQEAIRSKQTGQLREVTGKDQKWYQEQQKKEIERKRKSLSPISKPPALRTGKMSAKQAAHENKLMNIAKSLKDPDVPFKDIDQSYTFLGDVNWDLKNYPTDLNKSTSNTLRDIKRFEELQKGRNTMTEKEIAKEIKKQSK